MNAYIFAELNKIEAHTTQEITIIDKPLKYILIRCCLQNGINGMQWLGG